VSPQLSALPGAGAVGYDGKTEAEMRPIVRLLVAAHDESKVTATLMAMWDHYDLAVQRERHRLRPID
jgi:hypothetical protein